MIERKLDADAADRYETEESRLMLGLAQHAAVEELFDSTVAQQVRNALTSSNSETRASAIGKLEAAVRDLRRVKGIGEVEQLSRKISLTVTTQMSRLGRNSGLAISIDATTGMLSVTDPAILAQKQRTHVRKVQAGTTQPGGF